MKNLELTHSQIPRLLWLIFIISTLVLFSCASLRHWLFQSNALDLGWFDQSLYLISQGKPPIVSFSDDHILGDHAAFIFYPLSLFQKDFESSDKVNVWLWKGLEALTEF